MPTSTSMKLGVCPTPNTYIYNIKKQKTTDCVARVLDAHFQQVDEVGGLSQAKHLEGQLQGVVG